MIARRSGLNLSYCEVNSHLEKASVFVRAMYVSRHKNKFIKSAQTPLGRRPPVIDFQNEIIEIFVRREGEEEGVEAGRGRRFIRWAFTKSLRTNQTVAVMAKLRRNINQAFYIRYNYAYVLVNNETGLRMVFYKQQRGSPWITKYEEAFNSFRKTSPQCHEWLEKEEKRLGFHIHHASCGHGGERCFLGSPVDGYEPKSRTVFEFHGCFYHGCPRCVKTKRSEPTLIGKMPNQLYYATLTKTAALRQARFKVVEKWGCEYQYEGTPKPLKKNGDYPHFIFYDLVV